MKKLLLSLSLILAATLFLSAQTAKEIAKERKELKKLSQKEAKKYAKEGWLVSPGALPIEKQLDKAYQMQYERDEASFPKYIMGEAMSIGENYDAAKMQALELAKQLDKLLGWQNAEKQNIFPVFTDICILQYHEMQSNNN